jgi:type IV pilus assembly protein PilA
MKKNNKGFSLVELIIVIAIMAVLVGVLAPQFIKYVEQSRRSRDIQTAQEIREAVLASIADGKLTGSQDVVYTTVSGSIDTITEEPLTAGNKVAVGSHYYVSYNANTGTCAVYVGTTTKYTLTTEAGASDYKSV